MSKWQIYSAQQKDSIKTFGKGKRLWLGIKGRYQVKDDINILLTGKVLVDDPLPFHILENGGERIIRKKKSKD